MSPSLLDAVMTVYDNSSGLGGWEQDLPCLVSIHIDTIMTRRHWAEPRRSIRTHEDVFDLGKPPKTRRRK